MVDLDLTVKNLRKEYREIFLQSAEEIKKHVEEIKPKEVNGEIFDKYPSESAGQFWQKNTLKLLQGDISKEIYRKFSCA